MGQVFLLDCTLRDGGYVNDWDFGFDAIVDMERKLVSSGVDIVEIGFLKKESYNRNRTVFSDVKQIDAIISPKQKNILYAGMVEVINPLPVEELSPRVDTSIDIIRVIVWKRLLAEGYDYCKAIADKGYKLCIQPARVNQYSDKEFIQMIEMFNKLNPLAIYVVDSWGTQDVDSVLHYAHLADEHMAPEIALGFHGHNNLLQAFSCAQAFIEMNLKRKVIIDASIYGMGRGAGNLNIEIFAKFLNEKFNKRYNITPMLEIYSDYIAGIFDKTPWGYSLPYFLTAVHDCNPEFANYYGIEKKVPVKIISQIFNSISEKDKVIFNKETADSYLNRFWESI